MAGRKTPDTEWREKLCSAIEGYKAEHGFAPSVRELAALVDAPLITVHSALARLREAGIVDWVEGRNRTLKVTEWGMKAPDISL